MIFVKLIIGTVYILVFSATVVIADTGTLPPHRNKSIISGYSHMMEK